MELVEVKAIDIYVISHIMQRNMAIGAPIDYQLDDIIYTHDTHNKAIRFNNWALATEKAIKAMFLNSKCLALAHVIKALRKTDNIDEKRAYLVDAMYLEEEINTIIYGVDE